MHHAFLEAAAAYPIVGEAAWDFQGCDYGSGYLSLEEGDGVLLLPSPKGLETLGWAYGRKCGPEGWFPPSCFTASVEACELAKSHAVQSFTDELKLSAKLTDKLKTALLKQSTTLEQDLATLEDLLAGQKDHGAVIGNVVKRLDDGFTLQEQKLLVGSSSAVRTKRGVLDDGPEQVSVGHDDGEATSAEMPRHDENLKSLAPDASDAPYVYSRRIMLLSRHGHVHEGIKFLAVERTHLSRKRKDEQLDDFVQIEPACIAHVLAAAGGMTRVKQISVAVQALGMLSVPVSVKDLQEKVLSVVQSNPEQFKLHSDSRSVTLLDNSAQSTALGVLSHFPPERPNHK